MSDVETLTTAVVARNGAAPITERARTKYDPEQVRLMRNTVAKGCNDGEFAMFLEVAARYDLDPFCHEIYAAKMGGKNGSEGRVAIIVGRDGLLKVARRTGELEGLTGDVVCANDEFRKSNRDDEPEHSYGLDRGAIVGAWAVAYRAGCKPTYFYAPLSEYLPTGNRLQFTPWAHQKSAMILKCAQSLSLRLAFSITGVVAEEEMGRALTAEAESQQAIEWGNDPTIVVWLQELVAAVNTVTPDAYREAKLKAKLRGRSDEEREVFAAELVDRLNDAKVPVPDRPTQDDLDARAAEAEEEVVDVQVVTDDDASDAETVDDEGYEASDPQGDIPFGPPEEAVEGPVCGEAMLMSEDDTSAPECLLPPGHDGPHDERPADERGGDDASE